MSAAARIRELCEVGPSLGWDAFLTGLHEVVALVDAEVASGSMPADDDAADALLLRIILVLWHRAREILGPDAGDADFAADWAAALAMETAERRVAIVVRRREMKATSAGRRGNG